jgi:hypothetical protein
MDAQNAAKTLYEQYNYQNWLIAVGIAYSIEGNPTGLIVHASSPKKARSILPRTWEGYGVSILSGTQPRAYGAE